ncbi:hypothetical protein MTP99_004719 [Tenebrio molitor]|nr:hypothetical protein MTP99_004719 [Tenebrio molitor]
MTSPKKTFFQTLPTAVLKISEMIWRKKWKKEERSRKRPSLFRALFRTFGPKVIVYGAVLLVLEFTVTLLQPLRLKQSLEYYHPQLKNITKREVCQLFALAIISLSSKFSPLQFRILFFRVEKLCLIYRKYLKLKKETC